MFDFIFRQIESSPHTDLWTIASIAAIASAVAAVVALPIALWPIYQRRRTQQLLEKSFGAEFYDSDTIRNATRYYVRPKCSSVDPTQEAELRQVIVAEEDLFSAVDKYLSHESPHRHLLLLADSGMGKSAFVLNYYARNQRLPKKRRHRLAVIPLGIPHALAAIKRIENKKETVIFLDAFDEDTKAIQDHRGRLLELMQACSQFKRVLLTCRTQFFPTDEEIPKQTGIAVIRPRKPGESGVYEFWKYYLMPLGDKQVKEFINKRYSWTRRTERRQAMELVNKIPFLSVRPMILSYIPDLLESGRKYDFPYQIYEQMIAKWLERESHWLAPELLLKFSEELAVNLYLNRERRGFERISREELAEFIKETNISVEEWKATGRSLLNRDGLGNLKFSHRTIMEYLLVKQFVQGNLTFAGVPWTDQMLNFLWQMMQYPSQIPKKFVDSKSPDVGSRSALTLLYSELVSYRLKDCIDAPAFVTLGHLSDLMEICLHICTAYSSSQNASLFLYYIKEIYELEDDCFCADVSLISEVFNHRSWPYPISPHGGYLYSRRQVSILSEGEFNELREEAYFYAPSEVAGLSNIPAFFWTALDEAIESFKSELDKAVDSFMTKTSGTNPAAYLFIPIERDNIPIALLFAVSDDAALFDASHANILYAKLNPKSKS